MTLCWHVNVGCQFLLLFVSAHAAVLPTTINSGPSHDTDITIRPSELTETSTEQVLLEETTTRIVNSADTTTHEVLRAETTIKAVTYPNNIREPVNYAETTNQQVLPTETTPDPILLIGTRTGPVLPTKTIHGLVLNTEIIQRRDHSKRTTIRPSISDVTISSPGPFPGITTDSVTSAGTTTDDEVVPTITPLNTQKDPVVNDRDDAINFGDGPITLRSTSVNPKTSMDKTNSDKEFANTAPRFESTASNVHNYVKQKTEDKVVTKESDEPEELMSKSSEEKVHTQDNQIPINDKTNLNLTPTKIPTSNPDHQPRIINYSGMIFKHDSNQDDNQSSRVNFGGPTDIRETTSTNPLQEKDSRINFGGTIKEETTIESLNEIFPPQETIGESKQAEHCKKLNMIFSLHGNTCHTPTSVGPCDPSTHWFVAQDDSWVGICRPRLCTGQNTPFLYKGVCSPIHGKCGQGERLYNDRFGEGFCGCDDGFLYHAKDNKCYRENLRGPCVEGKQWVKKRGSWMDGVCKRRGCNGGRVKWQDGMCYKIQEGLAFQNCSASVEGVVKKVEKKNVLDCFMEIKMRAIAPVFQGRRCRRGRTWSRYRKRCVRSYGRG